MTDTNTRIEKLEEKCDRILFLLEKQELEERRKAKKKHLEEFSFKMGLKINSEPSFVNVILPLKVTSLFYTTKSQKTFTKADFKRDFLEEKSKEELIDFILSLVDEEKITTEKIE